MKKRKTNYKGMFLVGISMIAIGISLINSISGPIGIVFISVGGLFILKVIMNKKEKYE